MAASKDTVEVLYLYHLQKASGEMGGLLYCEKQNKEQAALDHFQTLYRTPGTITQVIQITHPINNNQS